MSTRYKKGSASHAASGSASSTSSVPFHDFIRLKVEPIFSPLDRKLEKSEEIAYQNILSLAKEVDLYSSRRVARYRFVKQGIEFMREQVLDLSSLKLWEIASDSRIHTSGIKDYLPYSYKNSFDFLVAIESKYSTGHPWGLGNKLAFSIRTTPTVLKMRRVNDEQWFYEFRNHIKNDLNHRRAERELQEHLKSERANSANTHAQMPKTESKPHIDEQKLREMEEKRLWKEKILSYLEPFESNAQAYKSNLDSVINRILGIMESSRSEILGDEKVSAFLKASEISNRRICDLKAKTEQHEYVLKSLGKANVSNLHEISAQFSYISRLSKGIGARYVEREGSPESFSMEIGELIRSLYALDEILYSELWMKFSDIRYDANGIFGKELFSRMQEAQLYTLALLNLLDGNADPQLIVKMARRVSVLEETLGDMQARGATPGRDAQVPDWVRMVLDGSAQNSTTGATGGAGGASAAIIDIEALKTNLSDCILYGHSLPSPIVESVVKTSKDYEVSFLDLSKIDAQLGSTPQARSAGLKANETPVLIFFNNGYSNDEKKTIFRKLIFASHPDKFAKDNIGEVDNLGTLNSSFTRQYTAFTDGIDFQAIVQSLSGGAPS